MVRPAPAAPAPRARTRCIAVFGASGMTGRAVVDEALRPGIAVRAFYRAGSKPEKLPRGVTAVEGRLDSPEDVRRALEGADAALCVFGPRLVARTAKPDVFCAEATRTIIAQMQALGVRKLVCQTGAMAGSDPSSLGPFYRWLRARYRRRLAPIAADREDQEAAVRASHLGWLLVRPPMIRDRPALGGARSARRMRIRPLSTTRVGDLAQFHVDTLTHGPLRCEAVYVVS